MGEERGRDPFDTANDMRSMADASLKVSLDDAPSLLDARRHQAECSVHLSQRRSLAEQVGENGAHRQPRRPAGGQAGGQAGGRAENKV
jgi:hypothetical protein